MSEGWDGFWSGEPDEWPVDEPPRRRSHGRGSRGARQGGGSRGNRRNGRRGGDSARRRDGGNSRQPQQRQGTPAHGDVVAFSGNEAFLQPGFDYADDACPALSDLQAQIGRIVQEKRLLDPTELRKWFRSKYPHYRDMRAVNNKIDNIARSMESIISITTLMFNALAITTVHHLEKIVFRIAKHKSNVQRFEDFGLGRFQDLPVVRGLFLGRKPPDTQPPHPDFEFPKIDVGQVVTLLLRATETVQASLPEEERQHSLGRILEEVIARVQDELMERVNKQRAQQRRRGKAGDDDDDDERGEAMEITDPSQLGVRIKPRAFSHLLCTRIKKAKARLNKCIHGIVDQSLDIVLSELRSVPDRIFPESRRCFTAIRALRSIQRLLRTDPAFRSHAAIALACLPSTTGSHPPDNYDNEPLEWGPKRDKGEKLRLETAWADDVQHVERCVLVFAWAALQVLRGYEPGHVLRALASKQVIDNAGSEGSADEERQAASEDDERQAASEGDMSSAYDDSEHSCSTDCEEVTNGFESSDNHSSDEKDWTAGRRGIVVPAHVADARAKFRGEVMQQMLEDLSTGQGVRSLDAIDVIEGAVVAALEAKGAQQLGTSLVGFVVKILPPPASKARPLLDRVLELCRQTTGFSSDDESAATADKATQAIEACDVPVNDVHRAFVTALKTALRGKATTSSMQDMDLAQLFTLLQSALATACQDFGAACVEALVPGSDRFTVVAAVANRIQDVLANYDVGFRTGADGAAAQQQQQSGGGGGGGGGHKGLRDAGGVGLGARVDGAAIAGFLHCLLGKHPSNNGSSTGDRDWVAETSAETAALARIAREHFGLHSAMDEEALERLVSGCLHEMPSPSDPTPDIPPLASFVVRFDNSSTSAATTSTGSCPTIAFPDVGAREGDKKAARAAIAEAPYLCDIAAATWWHHRYNRHHGALPSFIVRHFGSLSDQLGSDSSDLFVELQHGVVWKIRPLRLSDSNVLLQGTPTDLACALVAEVVRQGGVANVGCQLLHGHFKTQWHAWGPKRVCSHVLSTLERLPLPLIPDIGHDVLVEGARCVVPELPGLLLDAATTIQQRSLLRDMGRHAGLQEWLNAPLVVDGGSQAALSRRSSAGPVGITTTIDSRNDTSTAAVDASSLSISRTASVPFAEDSGPAVSAGGDAIDLSPDVCSSILQTIRSSYGEDSRDKDSMVLQRLRGELRKAVEKLANDLYSSQTHFLMELIQNADDNTYASQQKPTLSIAIGAGRIVLTNNEVGFSQRNVEALCRIGSSSKSAAQARFIGHKGIGFKSVFKVSDCPEIHSNNFHFKFDVHTNELGYIVPVALPAPAGWRPGRHTRIELPFNTRKDNNDGGGAGSTASRTEVTKEFRSQLVKELDPSLLLFLHSLKRLEVRDSELQLQRRLERHEVTSSNVVKLQDNNSSSFWMTTCKTLHPHAALREGVTTTEMVLALPLQTASSTETFTLPHQPVFSFLPVRSYGLKIILQADWILTSSRGAIHQGEAWNQWLREQIPVVFVKMCQWVIQHSNSNDFFAEIERNQEEEIDDDDNVLVEDDDEESMLSKDTMQVQDYTRPSNLLCLLLAALPVPGSTQDFFAATAQQVCAAVKTLHLIPTAERKFVPPPGAVLPPKDNTLTQQMLADIGALLQQADLAFVHRAVHIDPALARGLGLRTLDSKLLVQLLHKHFTSATPPSTGPADDRGTTRCSPQLSPPTLAWVLQRIETTRRQLGPSDWKALHATPFVPLVDGTMAALGDGALFELEQELAQGFPFLKRHRVVSAAFLAALRKEGRHEALALLHSCNLRRTTNASFLEDAIYPLLCNPDNVPAGAPRVKDRELVNMLVLCAAFGRRHNIAPETQAQRLQGQAMVVDAPGRRVNIARANCHIPFRPDGSRSRLTTYLSDEFVCEHDIFLPCLAFDYFEGQSKATHADLHALLRALGATDFAPITATTATYTSTAAAVEQEELHVCDLPSEHEAKVEVEDFACQLLASSLPHMSDDQKRELCADLLGNHLESTANVMRKRIRVGGECKSTAAPSAFCRTLQQHAWVAARNTRALLKPSQVFATAHNLFRTVDWSRIARPTEEVTSHLRLLGIAHSPSTRQVWAALTQPSEGAGAAAKAHGPAAILTAFGEVLGDAELMAELEAKSPEHLTLALPIGADDGDEGGTGGAERSERVAVPLSECVWEEPSHTRKKNRSATDPRTRAVTVFRSVLKKRVLKDFFRKSEMPELLHRLGVRTRPSIHDYVQAAQALEEKKSATANVEAKKLFAFSQLRVVTNIAYMLPGDLRFGDDDDDEDEDSADDGAGHGNASDPAHDIDGILSHLQENLPVPTVDAGYAAAYATDAVFVPGGDNLWSSLHVEECFKDTGTLFPLTDPTPLGGDMFIKDATAALPHVYTRALRLPSVMRALHICVDADKVVDTASAHEERVLLSFCRAVHAVLHTHADEATADAVLKTLRSATLKKAARIKARPHLYHKAVTGTEHRVESKKPLKILNHWALDTYTNTMFVVPSRNWHLSLSNLRDAFLLGLAHQVTLAVWRHVATILQDLVRTVDEGGKWMEHSQLQETLNSFGLSVPSDLLTRPVGDSKSDGQSDAEEEEDVGEEDVETASAEAEAAALAAKKKQEYMEIGKRALEVQQIKQPRRGGAGKPPPFSDPFFSGGSGVGGDGGAAGHRLDAANDGGDDDGAHREGGVRDGGDADAANDGGDDDGAHREGGVRDGGDGDAADDGGDDDGAHREGGVRDGGDADAADDGGDDDGAHREGGVRDGGQHDGGCARGDGRAVTEPRGDRDDAPLHIVAPVDVGALVDWSGVTEHADRLLTVEELREIGRVGERAAFAYLKTASTAAGAESDASAVAAALGDCGDVVWTWVNEHQEQYRPYDIVANPTQEGDAVRFVEVKTTLGLRDSVIVSSAEVEAAVKGSRAYVLAYVVLDTSHRTAQVYLIPDPIRTQRHVLLPVHPHHAAEEEAI